MAQNAHRDHHLQPQETLTSRSPPPTFLHLIKNTYLTSFQIFLSSPRIYLTILTFTTLPLSLLLTSLSFTTRHLHNHFNRLHYLSSVASTDVESLHVLKEARSDAFSLFFLKASYAFPSLFFSLISLITTVSVTSSAINAQQQPRTLRAVLTRTWKRPLWTAIVAYVITFSTVHITHTLLGPLVLMGEKTMVVFVVVDLVLEVYLMAVISLGLVVSVMEEDRSGFEAIQVGVRLMEGSRVFGWVLSGGFLFVSGWIGKQLRLMDGGGPGGGEDGMMMDVIFNYCYKGGLVILLALVVLWSYIIGTVYYCQCRRRRDQQTVEGHEDDPCI